MDMLYQFWIVLESWKEPLHELATKVFSVGRRVFQPFIVLELSAVDQDQMIVDKASVAVEIRVAIANAFLAADHKSLDRIAEQELCTLSIALLHQCCKSRDNQVCA